MFFKRVRMTLQEPRLRLGLCCLNTELREQKPTVFASRGCIQSTLEKNGIEFAQSIAKANIRDLFTMMDWNYQHGIEVFRLSSNIFPHITNHALDLCNYNLEFAEGILGKLGKFAESRGQRITFHPGQFNVLGTPNIDALQKTMYELYTHAQILNYMNCPPDSVMVIHGGGVYGNKRETMDRWCKNYMKLPEDTRERLVLENCEKNFNIEDCLEISRRVGVPVVLDNHHFFCYNQIHTDIKPKYDISTYIPMVLDTWAKKGIRPKFHISEQGSGKTGHHSDFITELPDYYLEIPEKYGVGVDVMVEAKMKEQAIFKLYNTHRELFGQFIK